MCPLGTRRRLSCSPASETPRQTQKVLHTQAACVPDACVRRRDNSSTSEPTASWVRSDVRPASGVGPDTSSRHHSAVKGMTQCTAGSGGGLSGYTLREGHGTERSVQLPKWPRQPLSLPHVRSYSSGGLLGPVPGPTQGGMQCPLTLLASPEETARKHLPSVPDASSHPDLDFPPHLGPTENPTASPAVHTRGGCVLKS